MITIISGFGRCGSSLLMQMLNAGGMTCLGSFPAFEDKRVDRNGDLDFLRDHDGCAVKVLDPHRYRFPEGVLFGAIWLDRDLKEQAKSTIKFQKRVLGMPGVGRADVSGCKRLLREERPFAIAALHKLTGKQILFLRFESILTAPRDVAKILSSFCGGLDVDAMTRVVVPRKPQCLRDFLETELILKGMDDADQLKAHR